MKSYSDGFQKYWQCKCEHLLATWSPYIICPNCGRDNSNFILVIRELVHTRKNWWSSWESHYEEPTYFGDK